MKDSGKQEHSIDRREVLALGAAGVGALALNSSPLSLTRAFAATGSARPNFYPAPVAPADIPGDANGLEPAYINFPKKLVKLVDETPGRGSEVNCMSLWVWPIPTPVAQNAGWQQFQKKVNVSIKMNYVPQADYAAKWGTVTAGGDLPDILNISLVPVLPNIAAFVNSACAELTEYLAGDAVKAYPGLANIPSACWSQAIIDGKLWGVPIAREVTGWPMFAQAGLLEKLGMAGKWPTNADDFKAFCKALNNPSRGTLGDGRYQRHDGRPLFDELVPGRVPCAKQMATQRQRLAHQGNRDRGIQGGARLQSRTRPARLRLPGREVELRLVQRPPRRQDRHAGQCLGELQVGARRAGQGGQQDLRHRTALRT